MKRLLATGLLLLLASVPLFAQEKVAIVPPPSADTSAAADAESTSATPGEKTALPSAQEITRTLPAEPGKEPQLNEHEIAILNPETQEWEVSEFAINGCCRAYSGVRFRRLDAVCCGPLCENDGYETFGDDRLLVRGGTDARFGDGELRV